MSLTNIARVDKIGGAPGDPSYEDVVTMDLDASYPAGGYDLAELSADGILLAAEIGKGRTILTVHQNNIPGTPKVYITWDRANRKLVCNDFAGAEIAGGTNLSGVVGLELVFRSK